MFLGFFCFFDIFFFFYELKSLFYSYVYFYISFFSTQTNIIMHIEFFTLTMLKNNIIFFKPLQENIFVNIKETSLIFFRVFNTSNDNVKIITTYTIFPYYYSIFLNKIQCFCFDTIFLKKNSTIDLPVLFNFDIPYSSFFTTKHKITFIYTLFNV